MGFVVFDRADARHDGAVITGEVVADFGVGHLEFLTKEGHGDFARQRLGRATRAAIPAAAPQPGKEDFKLGDHFKKV